MLFDNKLHITTYADDSAIVSNLENCMILMLETVLYSSKELALHFNLDQYKTRSFIKTRSLMSKSIYSEIKLSNHQLLMKMKNILKFNRGKNCRFITNSSSKIRSSKIRTILFLMYYLQVELKKCSYMTSTIILETSYDISPIFR